MYSNNPAFQISPEKSPLILSLLLLVTLGSLWGGMTALAKFITTAGVPILGYAFWQTFGAGVLLTITCIVLKKPPPLNFKSLRHYLIVGAVGSAIPTTNLFYSLSKLPTGIVALVITTVPLFTYLLSLGVRLEHYDWRRALGISLGFAGSLIILLPDSSLPSRDLIPFVLLAFISPLFYSINSIYASKFQSIHLDPIHTATGMMVSSSFMLLIASLATNTFHPIWKNFDLADSLIVLHMALAALTFFMYFLLLRRAGPVYFSQVAFIVTLNAIMWGVLLFDEQHSVWIWVALALIFLGVALVNLRQKKQSSQVKKL